MSSTEQPGESARPGVQDGAGRSWPANTNNSASAGSGPETPDSETRPSDLPTVRERVEEVKEEYEERAFQPVSEEEGRRLRAACVEERREEEAVNPSEEWKSPFTVERVTERTALPWIAVVEEFLEWYEGYRDKHVKFAKGRGGTDEYESFTKELDNSFQPEYQSADFAKLKALERELIGGERPTGEECEGAYEEPYTAIITRSASSRPGGGYAPPADHDRAIAEAWNDGVKRSLRYVLEERLGVASDRWEYHKQGEPHPGGGEAAGYGHDHTVLFVDLGGVEADGGDLDLLLRSVTQKHVETCEWAGEEAHGEGSVEVRDAEEFEAGAASYAASYLSIDEERDLLERSPEYLMWAATQWATATQKGVRSDGANAAIAADRCKQRCESPEADQEVQHGEEIRRSARRGAEFECAACGSPWGVRQDYDTLTAARTDDGEERPCEAVRAAVATAGPEPVDRSADSVTDQVAADGGVDTETKADLLRGRWPSARSAAIVGRDCEELDVADKFNTAGVAVGFERLPEWRAESIIQHGEEFPVKRLGGVEMKRLKFRELPDPSGGVVVDEETGEAVLCDGTHRIVSGSGVPYCKRCGVSKQSLLDYYGVPASDMEPGEVEEAPEGPDPEKQMWPDAEEPEGGPTIPEWETGREGFDRQGVREYVEAHPEAGVREVMATLLLPAEAEEFVEEVVGR